MAAAYKATLTLNPVSGSEQARYDRIGKFPGNFPSTAEEERETNEMKEAQNNQEAIGFRRELVFKPGQRVHEIGRASSNPSRGLAPHKANGYFFSPVMSRNHAMIKMRRQKLYIEDRGSMHGTFHNGNHIKEAERVELKTGDHLSFGTQITRGDAVYHPKEFECELTWEPILTTVSPKPQPDHVSEDNRRRSCGYGVTDEDLIVSENEMDMDWHSNRDDSESDEMSDSQMTENEGEPYSDEYDEYDDYYEEDHYMEETEEVISPISTPVGPSTDPKQSLKNPQPEEEKVEVVSSLSSKEDSTGKKWQNLALETTSDPETKKQEKVESNTEGTETDNQKPRAAKFSIGSLMNESNTAQGTAVAVESLVSDDEVEEIWSSGPTNNQNGYTGRLGATGSKVTLISLLDDDDDGDMECEDDFDLYSEANGAQDKKIESNSDDLSQKDMESDDEPPEEVRAKGDEETVKTRWTTSSQEAPLPTKSSQMQESKPLQDNFTAKPSFPQLPPLYQHRPNNNNSNGDQRIAPNVYNLLQSSESLAVHHPTRTTNNNSLEGPQAKQTQQQAHTSLSDSAEAARAALKAKVTERLKQYFAVRQANAAALARLPENNSVECTNTPILRVENFDTPMNNIPAIPSLQAKPLPWVYPACRGADGRSPYGLFPVIQERPQDQQSNACAPSPKSVTIGETINQSGNIKKPNMFEQILSSDETKAKRAVVEGMRADLEKMKAHFQQTNAEKVGWRDLADTSLLDTAPHERGLDDEMGDDLEDVNTDIRTDVSEAGSNATSTERRNASLMQEQSDFSLGDHDHSFPSPTCAKTVNVPATRCPISSLVNEQPAETNVTESKPPIKIREIHELDVMPTGYSRKRKFHDIDDDDDDDDDSDGVVDQKEVAEKQHFRQSVNSDDDVPKEVTMDAIVHEVASIDIEPTEGVSMEPLRKRQRSWPTIATTFALGAAMGGVGMFAALVATAPN